MGEIWHPLLSFVFHASHTFFLLHTQFLGGTRSSGNDVRLSNVTAVQAVANLVKTSLGPTGLDTLLVDDTTGDVVITNDGATLVQHLPLEHAATRVLVDLAQRQDGEVGDGTTSVVLLTASLLKRALHLQQQGRGLHPVSILAGYKRALKEAIKFLKNELTIPTQQLDDKVLLQAARTSLSSKLMGTMGTTTEDDSSESFQLAQLAVQAVQSIGVEDPISGKKTYSLNSIHVLKAHGQSATDSTVLLGGFALAAQRAAQGMPTSITSDDGSNIKIALLDMNLQRHRMGLGITMQVSDPAELEKIRQQEVAITQKKIQVLLDAGAKVVLTTKGIDDICLKYLVQAGVLAARRVPRDELDRLAQAAGGQIVSTLADLEGNESLDPASLGTCSAVREVRVGDNEMLYFDNVGSGSTVTTKASTVLLRGPNEYFLDELDRALHDAICVVKRVLESQSIVPGGGAVEAALCVHLQRFANSDTKLNAREQDAVLEFAQALLTIPTTLAVNAALDSTELVAQLCAVHNEASNDVKHHFGLDLMEGVVRNSVEAGVVEPAIAKVKALRLATEAASTLFRIDDRIQTADVQNQAMMQ